MKYGTFEKCRKSPQGLCTNYTDSKTQILYVLRSMFERFVYRLLI